MMESPGPHSLHLLFRFQVDLCSGGVPEHVVLDAVCDVMRPVALLSDPPDESKFQVSVPQAGQDAVVVRRVEIGSELTISVLDVEQRPPGILIGVEALIDEPEPT